MLVAVYLILVEFTIGTRITALEVNQNSFTLIGNRNITRRSNAIHASLSKLIIRGRFNCYVTWTTNATQTIEISTDSNIQSSVIAAVDRGTLQLTHPSAVDIKFTELNVHLTLHPTLREIFLAGISHFQSIDVFTSSEPLALHTEGRQQRASSHLEQHCSDLDTSSLVLALDVWQLNALFLSAGSTNLSGRVNDKAAIKYHGIGDVDASRLFCQRVDLYANGLGTVWISGVDECTINAEGVSIVKYRCTHIKSAQLTGLARIIPV